MKRKPFIVSAILSIFITIVLWNTCPYFVKRVGQFIFAFGYRIPHWELFHGVFALSFGLIPALSFLIWRWGKFAKLFSLIFLSVFTFIVALTISIYSFMHYSDVTQLILPYIPRIKPTHSIFNQLTMNYVIPISVLIPCLFLFFVALIWRGRSREVDLLDQSAAS